MRWFDVMMAAFVAILLLSNVLGAGKVAKVNLPLIGDWPFGAGILFFPLGYLLGDVLTEVYGYARARRCVWVGFAALLFMAFMSWVVVSLPPPPTGPARPPMKRSSGKSRASFWPASAPSGSGSSPTALSWPG
jgi:uncharacterized PurR-regulated membrane protein YhhQ (DUF165 family)